MPEISPPPHQPNVPAPAPPVDRAPAAAAALPQVVGKPMFISPDQETAALAYLSTHWAKAIA